MAAQEKNTIVPHYLLQDIGNAKAVGNMVDGLCVEKPISFICDNVVDWMAGRSEKLTDTNHGFFQESPSIPPFKNSFYEFPGGCLTPFPFGLLCYTDEAGKFEFPNGNFRNEIQDGYKAASIMGCTILDKRFRDYLIQNNVTESYLGDRHKKKPLFCMFISTAIYDASGRLKSISTYPEARMSNASCTSFVLANIFANCKNITVEDISDFASPSWQWKKKHKDLADLKYYVLDIGGNTRRAYLSGNKTDIKQALHIVRGNFATYTESNPLFGKFTGTYWRPAHVRGDKKHGEIVKDYNVKPPQTLTESPA